MRCTCCVNSKMPVLLFGKARVCRVKKSAKGGEANATALSEALPFLEYELHRQLMYKLRIHAKNAVFGLRLQLSVGESIIIATAEATAVCLASLPLATALHIRRNLEVHCIHCHPNTTPALHTDPTRTPHRRNLAPTPPRPLVLYEEDESWALLPLTTHYLLNTASTSTTHYRGAGRGRRELGPPSTEDRKPLSPLRRPPPPTAARCACCLPRQTRRCSF